MKNLEQQLITARLHRDEALKEQLIQLLLHLKSNDVSEIVDTWIVELKSGRRKVLIDDTIRMG